ncbi:MAG: putative quinol monooxygenase [Rubrobacter sp.]
MMDGQVTVIATVKAKAGMEDRLFEETQLLVAGSRGDEGCLNFDLHRGIEDPSQLALYENWANQRLLDEHLEQPHVRDWQARLDELSEGGGSRSRPSPRSAP